MYASPSPAQIVVLNGAPRSGKSSIAAVIQETFDGPWMNLGVDIARAMTPARYQPGIGLRPGEAAHPVAPHVPAFYAALYESIAAHSRAGLNVVVDIGHHDAEILADCARRLADLPALFVGVRCPVEVIMERRDASPGGHYATGSADEPVPAPVRLWERDVHAPGVYDVEVDTSVLSPEQCADAIRQRLESGAPPTAFRALADAALRKKRRGWYANPGGELSAQQGSPPRRQPRARANWHEARRFSSLLPCGGCPHRYASLRAHHAAKGRCRDRARDRDIYGDGVRRVDSVDRVGGVRPRRGRWAGARAGPVQVRQ